MSEKLDNSKRVFFEEFNNQKENLTIKKEDIINQLKEVFDPEIPVNIYDLGLIYEIGINDEKKVKIEMTLTSPNCPVAESLPQEVSQKIKKLSSMTSLAVYLTFDPPWDQDMMSEDAKLALDIP
jgi:FeS assembly SUF system protein